MVDNVKCPCCYRCAKQTDQECSPETENEILSYDYCDGAGLRCQKITSRGSSTAIGRCVGELIVGFVVNAGDVIFAIYFINVYVSLETSN